MDTSFSLCLLDLNTPQPERVERTKSGGFILRKKNKPHMTYGPRLQDAMLYLENKKMYPTPTAYEFQQKHETSRKRMEKYKKMGKATGGIRNLSQEVLNEEIAKKKMYPTPRTGAGSRPNGKGGKELEEEVMIEAGLRERGKKLKQMLSLIHISEPTRPY